MSDTNSALPPRLLRTEEAARWLGLSGRTLEKHRCTGKGPSFRKLGGRVVYTVGDLQAWVDGAERRSTAPHELAAVRPAGRRASERRTFAR